VHKASHDASPLVPNLGFTFTHGASIVLALTVVNADRWMRRTGFLSSAQLLKVGKASRFH